METPEPLSLGQLVSATRNMRAQMRPLAHGTVVAEVTHNTNACRFAPAVTSSDRTPDANERPMALVVTVASFVNSD